MSDNNHDEDDKTLFSETVNTNRNLICAVIIGALIVAFIWTLIESI